ncbi:MAG TPA: hypothetical protein PLF91_14040, partial [Mycolicibacterium fallax]|nr:hypothetical protein [Mycolicibacterium fallax]
VRLWGRDPDTVSLSTADKAKIAELVNDRLLEGWEHALWPETLVVEERQYRPTWDGTYAYTTDDQVYREDALGVGRYYTALQNSTNKDPLTETTYWEESGDEWSHTIPYTISFEQYDETVIWRVDTDNCLFRVDPRINVSSQKLTNVRIIEDAICVEQLPAPVKPWIRFQPAPSEYSWTEWASGTAYGIGDLVYLAATGESYKALAASTNKSPATETEYWEAVGFPWFLRSFVKYAVVADLMEEDSGKARMWKKAEDELDRLVDTRIKAVGQMEKVKFR